MKNLNEEANSEFHAVEFMRQIRSELSQKYLHDQEQYLRGLKKAMSDFKHRQVEMLRKN